MVASIGFPKCRTASASGLSNIVDILLEGEPDERTISLSQIGPPPRRTMVLSQMIATMQERIFHTLAEVLESADFFWVQKGDTEHQPITLYDDLIRTRVSRVGRKPGQPTQVGKSLDLISYAGSGK